MNNSDKVVGAALFVGLGLGFWQQASGSEAAVYYSPHVLEVRAVFLGCFQAFVGGRGEGARVVS